MATVFKITVVHEDALYARQAATAAFAELERIEGRLSRYAEGSDVFRINRLAAGQSTRVHPDTFACLQIAREVEEQTHGAFDVTYGSTVPAVTGPRMALEPESLQVRALVQGLKVDLGGIGKGFALDRLAEWLREWEVNSALLNASTSTLLALDPPPDATGWAVRIGPEHDSQRCLLARGAMSGSGFRVKGCHIVDPRTRQPARQRLGAWAGAPAAAISDALSTAFMVLDARAVRAYCQAHPAVTAYLWESASAPLETIPPG